jgi:alpha-tubulin suppressor-like RCC1 family protein
LGDNVDRYVPTEVLFFQNIQKTVRDLQPFTAGVVALTTNGDLYGVGNGQDGVL